MSNQILKIFLNVYINKTFLKTVLHCLAIQSHMYVNNIVQIYIAL